jgi:hypothetical protein
MIMIEVVVDGSFLEQFCGGHEKATGNAMIRIPIWAWITLAALGCGSASKPEDKFVEAHKQDSDFDTTMLCKHWYQSSEEQVDDVNQIYRADNSKLPPSRFRMQYIFLADGTCDWYYLSPDDGHEFKPGRWKILSNDPLTLEFTKGLAVEEYKVAELTDDVLRLTLISKLPK